MPEPALRYPKIVDKVANGWRDAGGDELDVDEVPLGEGTGALKQVGAMLFGGTLRADTLQIYELRAGGRPPHHYLQLVSGGTAFPGLHVVRLDASIRASALLARGILLKGWRCRDPEVLAWLKRQRRPRDLSWYWLGGDLEWAVAARPLAGGGSTVVVQVAGASAHLPLGFRALEDASSLFTECAAALPGSGAGADFPVAIPLVEVFAALLQRGRASPTSTA